MKRRDFVAASLLAGLTPMTQFAQAEPRDNDGKELFELRLIKLDSAEKQKALIDFYADALIPALDRAGVGPVGVFTFDNDSNKEKSDNVYVVTPHKSLESVMGLAKKLGADSTFLDAGRDFIGAPFDDPAYQRVETSLLLGFDDMPKLETPAKGADRVFQLRIYESHSVWFGLKKIHMFNEGGEIDLFRRTGLAPVFFGQAIIGDKLPNLTYMLGFNNRAEGDAAWKKFIAHPEWKAMSSKPFYKDTVSNITNIWLKPARGSQI